MVLITSAESNASYFPNTQSNDSVFQGISPGSIWMGLGSNSATLQVTPSNVAVTGSLGATSYTGLPTANTTRAGIVMLSTSTNSGSTTTAATSSAVAAIYPITLAVNVATANQTLLQSGTSYVNVRGDTSNVGINCTPALGYALDVAGQIRATNDITAFSDIRYKYDLVKIPDALAKVHLLNGYTFKRNDDPEEHTDKRYVGVIAQEVQAVIPEAVQVDSEKGLSVAYGNLNALLIEAIKELSDRVKQLEK